MSVLTHEQLQEIERMLEPGNEGTTSATGYECPHCGRDLTGPIDKINCSGHGDGAGGLVTCESCGTHIGVSIEIVTEVTLTTFAS